MRWCVVLLLMLPAAAGEGVYLTDERSSAPAVGTTVYALTDEVPAGDAAKKVYLATGLGALTYTTQFDYTVTEELRADGELPFTVFIACDVQSVVRPGNAAAAASARAVLLKDGTALHQVDKYELRTCDGPSDVWEAQFVLEGGGTVFAPGSTLSLQLLLWVPNGPPGTQAQNFYTLAGSTEHPAGLTGLTSAAAPAPAVPEAIDVAFNGTLMHAWENHTMVYLLNATVPEERVLGLDVAVAAGAVTVLAGGVNHTFDRTGNATMPLPPGNHTIEIAYEGFSGNLTLAYLPVPEPAAPAGEADDASGGEEAGVEDAGPLEDEQSPLPLGAVMVALWLAVRRRQPM